MLADLLDILEIWLLTSLLVGWFLARAAVRLRGSASFAIDDLWGIASAYGDDFDLERCDALIVALRVLEQDRRACRCGGGTRVVARARR